MNVCVSASNVVQDKKSLINFYVKSQEGTFSCQLPPNSDFLLGSKILL